MNNITEVFVINLDKCKQRLKSFDQNMKQYNIKYTRWDATYGKELSKDYIKQKTTTWCNHVCNHGIIGCHLSHINLWKYIQQKYQNNNNKWFIIFEDDAHIKQNFIDNLEKVFHDLKHWNYINRYPELIHLSSEVLYNIYPITPNIFKSPLVNTTRGYMINIQGIKKLLNIFIKVNYHVDIMMSLNNLINNDIAYYTTKPLVINQDNNNSIITMNTIPRTFPDIFNILFGSQNSMRLVYDGPIFTIHRNISINILIFISIILIAFLLVKKLYIILALYIIIEILYIILCNYKKIDTKC